MKFDENLRELRKEKGYSQEELADRMNVTRQTVSKWENGFAMPDLKKLTELAEFFGVSMDELLGIENKKEKGEEIGFEAYLQYADRLVAALEERQNHALSNKLKTFSVVVASVLAVTIIVLMIWGANFSSNIKSNIYSMSSSIVDLQNTVNSIGYPSNDEPYHLTYDVEITFKKARTDKPYIVEAELKYAPTSYAKDSKVYFSVPKADGSIEKLEAEEVNGAFVLITDVDMTVKGPFYFFLDDGSEILKQEILLNSLCTYYCEVESTFTYNVTKQQNANNYNFERATQPSIFSFSSIASDEIDSAEFIVENGGKEVFSKGVYFQRNEAEKSFDITLSDYTVENMGRPDELVAYLRITDKLGIVYKIYLNIEYSNGNDIYVFNDSHLEIIFNDDDAGEIIVSEHDYYGSIE